MSDEPTKREKDLDRELRDHLELDAEAKMDRGLGADEAHYAAQRDFGNTTLVKEVTREMWAWSFLERFAQNVRFGLRVVRRNPGFAAVAILTLALGIGANTAVFSVVNAIFLKPLPFPESERIFLVARTNNKIGGTNISTPIFLAWKEKKGLFDALGMAWPGGTTILTGRGDAEQIPAYVLSSEVMSVLGVSPALGRGFQPDEAKVGGPRAILISNALWRRKFSADPKIIGQTITLSGTPRIVEGVMPPGFEIPIPVGRDAQIWFLAQVASSSNDPSNFTFCIGRLSHGVTTAQAEAVLTTPIAGLHDLFPKMIAADERVHLTTLRTFTTNRAGTAPLLLLGAAGFVLLIACANVANLSLSRAASRQREIAVRTAMGAKRSQIAWQLLTESLVLGLAGGLAGLFACYMSFDFILSLVPTDSARFGSIELDGRVLAFSLILGILTGALSGLAPALQASTVDLQTALKEGKAGAGAGRKRGRLSSALVVSEVGLSLVLLVGAALMFQTLAGLLHTKRGFDSHNLLTFAILLPLRTAFNTKEKAIAFYDNFDAKLSALPGVQTVSYTSILPLDLQAPDTLLSVEGNSKFDGKTFDAGFRFISPEYFHAFRIPLVRGREITNADSGDSEPVVLINQTMARRIWGDEDAIGQHLWFGKPMGPDSMEPAPRRVVGIVSDVIENSLEQKETSSTMYIPYAQTHGPADEATFMIRTAKDPSALTPTVREILRSLAPDAPLRAPKTMDELVADSLDGHRFPTILISLFGGIALLIAAVGVYGVISYSVAQRTQEIGIRVALGSSRGRILRMVLARGLWLAAIGAIVGLIASHWLADLLRDQLYGISPSDPATLAGATFVLLAVAFVACWIPARRATRVDPLVALRYE
jgi:putative ABC transport system permease protein